MTFRFMTLNLNYDGEKHGPWHERRELIARAIKRHQPDVLALQAVKKAGKEPDQAAQLSQSLPDYPHAVFCAAQQDGSMALGSAFLSRRELPDIDVLTLSRNRETEDPFSRIVLHAHHKAEAEVRLFNAHFSWVQQQAANNLDECLSYLDLFSTPRIWAGDFNTPPDSPLISRIRAHGWLDVWTEKCGEAVGFTFESGDPKSRIDYIWMDPTLRHQLREVVLVHEEPLSKTRHLSDHLGLMVIFHLS